MRALLCLATNAFLTCLPVCVRVCLFVLFHPQCECSSVETIRLTDQGLDPNGGGVIPITTITDAIAAAPPGCILVTPTPEELIIYPVGAITILLPFVAGPEIATCIPDSIALGGCGTVFTDLAGNPVVLPCSGNPAVLAWDCTNLNVNEPYVGLSGPNQARTTPAPAFPPVLGAPVFAAYYHCCVEQACADYVEPTTEAPTPAPTKGKSRRLV